MRYVVWWNCECVDAAATADFNVTVGDFCRCVFTYCMHVHINCGYAYNVIVYVTSSS